MAFKFAESIQRGILYLSKSDKDFYLQIINLIKPEYFEYDAHKNIFNVIVNHYSKYKTLPNDHIILNTVKEEFLTSRDSVGDYETEFELINNVEAPTLDNKEYFLDQIEKFAKKEAIKLAIAKSINLIKEENFGEIEAEIKKALSVNRNIDLGQDYFNDFGKRWDRLSLEVSGLKFSTVFTKINEALEGGLERKEFGMVVAIPGVGKSVYLVNQGVNGLKRNKKVLHASAEMSEDRTAQRYDAQMALVPLEALKNSRELVAERLKIFKETFPDSQLKIKQFPTKTATVNTIRGLLNQLKNYEDFIPDIIIVDYLELLNPTTEGMAEYQAQERIAQELRGLAIETNTVIWTATQPNREGAKSQIITDINLGDSYGKIRPPDLCISLNQTTQEYDQGIMRVHVMKSRNSKQRFTFPISIDYKTLAMSDFTPKE